MNLNDFNHYQTCAYATMKQDDFEMTMLHCAMGMAGESGELAELEADDIGKRLGEIGDCMWYVANALHAMNYPMQQMVDDIHKQWVETPVIVNTNPHRLLMLQGLRFIDYMKKCVFYRKEIENDKLHLALYAYLEALLRICGAWGVLPMDAAKANIVKLSTRYPDGFFSALHAINRNTAAEDAAAGLTGTC